MIGNGLLHYHAGQHGHPALHHFLTEVWETVLQVCQLIGIAALFAIGLLVPWNVGMEIVGYNEFGRITVAVLSIACMFGLPLLALSVPDMIRSYRMRHDKPED